MKKNNALISSGNGQKKGRPPKKIDLEKLGRLRNSGLSYRRLAKVMNISVKTVIKNLNSTLIKQEPQRISSPGFNFSLEFESRRERKRNLKMGSKIDPKRDLKSESKEEELRSEF